MASRTLPRPDRRTLATRGRRLEYVTITWNSLEGVIAVTAGSLAGSISLVGFGVDSVIEVASGVVLLWRMWLDADQGRREKHERLALQGVSWCFLALAAYVAVEASATLWVREAPGHSTAGILLACASLIVMPFLSRAKRRVATGMNSVAMHADARQTEFCTYLSGILLGGLALNALLGWWWADPVAALGMAPIIAKEGFDGVRGRGCTC